MEMIVKLNVMLHAKPSVHDKHNLYHLPKTIFVVFPFTLKLTDTPKSFEINVCMCEHLI